MSINLLFLFIVLFNYVSRIWPRPQRSGLSVRESSILIPCLNEEEDLQTTIPTVKSVLGSKITAIYLDDGSSDASYSILEKYQSERLEVIKGNPVRPLGWKGKSWALQNLYEYEKEKRNAEYIILTDADDELEPEIIETSFALMEKHGLDMLSFFPGQSFGGLIERLFSPIADIILFTLLPLTLVRRTSLTSLAAANGQWVLVRREILDELGGFTELRQFTAEDTALARIAKSKGYKVAVYSGIYLIRTRMYEGYKEIVNGYTKNLYSIAGNNSILTILMGCIYLIAGVGALSSLFFVNYYPFALLPFLIMIFWRGTLSERLGHGFWAVILFPITSMVLFYIACRSAIMVPRGKASWKGRQL